MKRVFRPILICFMLFFANGLAAQTINAFSYAVRAKVDLREFSPSYHANVFSHEAPFPGSDSYRNYIHQLKHLYFGQTTDSVPAVPKSIQATSTEQAVISQGFEGNFFGGIPNDNDLAISNDGIIVSVTNSDLYVFDEDGNNIYDVGLEDIADSIGLVANSYDPKVVYDPGTDRFILVFLNGNNSNATNIVVCFSESNDPTAGWHVYALDGNPLNNNAWSDFPMIAMTEQDFFVTVNHINSDSASWQTGFMQSVIWQVQKSQGYAGDPITAVLHSDVNFQGKAIRNLRPVKGGFSLKNHTMYFISNRNFDFANDTFFVVKINESLEQNTSPLFTTQAVLANANYGMPPDAKQTPTTFLQTNDARPLGAIIENGVIHFVGNTVRSSASESSVYHGRLNTLSTPWEIDLHIFEDTSLEYGYPNLSFTGQTPFDEQFILSFNHTSVDSFPGVSAIFYARETGYSDRLHLASGTSNVNVISGNYERWGDYSGSQKKYNEPGVVWISGFMGFRNNLAISPNQHRTYIAKLLSPDSTQTNVQTLTFNESKLFPNPAEDYFFFQFELDEEMKLRFDLLDNLGRKHVTLLEESVKAGKNEFLFSTQSLPEGMYYLYINDEQGITRFTSQVIKSR